MKTIFSLNDEIAAARLQLADAAPEPPARREKSQGCNCDRWGHPCANCDERSLQPKTELPISESNQETR